MLRRSVISTALLTLVALSCAAAAGCNGVIMNPGNGMYEETDAGTTVPGEDAGPAADRGAAVFESTVRPILEDSSNGCVRCHGATGGDTAPAFLVEEPTMYLAILRYPGLINIDDPLSSRIFTYPESGRHVGGISLDADDKGAIVDWISLEATEREGEEEVDPALATEPVSLSGGFRSMSLDSVGAPGAAIHFYVDRYEGAGLCLIDRITVEGGPEGVRMVHPVFVFTDGETVTPDPIDRFAPMDLTVEPGESAPFAVFGDAAAGYDVSDCSEGMSLQIFFLEVETVTGSDDGEADAGAADADAGV